MVIITCVFRLWNSRKAADQHLGSTFDDFTHDSKDCVAERALVVLGMNLTNCAMIVTCFHRYTSYWISTMCIPEDYDLRRGAIEYIDNIFTCSKTIFVIDRALMAIDITSRENDIELQESLLATFLACGWNVC